MQVVKWSLPALLIATVLSIPSYSATPDRIAGALNREQTVTLHGAVSRKALPKYDLGVAEPALRFQSVMLLTVPTASQQQALTQLLAQQQDRKSPNYHKWLTPEQWANQFGLSANDVAKISAWLIDQGFTNIRVARGRNWFAFDGTAAQIQSAFGTEIHRYNVNGEMHVANATAPKIPAALGGIVTGIRGLDNFYLKPRVMPRVRPMYYSSTYGDFMAPGDVATIYDITPLYNSSPAIDGTGQKIAIMAQTDIYLDDINDFRTNFGLSSISCTTNSSTGIITACDDPHFQYVVPTGVEDPGAPSSGDLGESDLDVEWSGAVARGAQIIFVNTPANTSTAAPVTGGGVWESWYYAVDQNLAPVISLSYGGCEFNDNDIYDVSTGEPGPDEVELKQANSEGITFVNSSGDSGAAECDPDLGAPSPTDPYGASATGGWAVSYPASSPEVTGVGGNSLALSEIDSATYWGKSNNSNGGSALSYVPEQAWNDDAEFALYCSAGQAGAGSDFCTQGGSSKVAGWVSITNQQQAQEDFALPPYYDGISASGGGASNCEVQNSNYTACVSGFPQPSWQSGLTVSGVPAGVRWVPDVSFLASPNFPGYIFCTPLSELGGSGTTSSCAGGIETAIGDSSIVGGTSVAAPLFAGIVTLLNQSLSSSGGLGNVNQTLYQIAGDTSNGAFHQVTSGTVTTNTVYCTAGTPGSPQPSALDCPSTGPLGFNATANDSNTGYNLVTGLGSVDVDKLEQALTASFTLSAGSINPTTVAAGNNVTATISFAPSNGSNFNGTPSFSCANQTGIKCNFSTPTGSGTGSTTVTISVAANVAAGATTVTVTGTSGSVSANTTVGFTVTATTQSFSLSSNLGASGAGTLTVKQGLSGQVNMTVNSTNGFLTTSGGNTQTTLPVTYTCSGIPTLTTCTFSPTSPTQAAAVTVNITTTAPTSAQARPENGNPRIFYAALLPGLFGIMFVAGSRKRSLRGMRMLGLIMVLGVSTLWLGSCGGSNNGSTGNPGTPVGSYTITINATTGGSAPITSSYQFTLSVTQ